jgi:hypothetical protein
MMWVAAIATLLVLGLLAGLLVGGLAGLLWCAVSWASALIVRVVQQWKAEQLPPPLDRPEDPERAVRERFERRRRAELERSVHLARARQEHNGRHLKLQ